MATSWETSAPHCDEMPALLSTEQLKADRTPPKLWNMTECDGEQHRSSFVPSTEKQFSFISTGLRAFRKRNMFPKRVTEVLRAWLKEHAKVCLRIFSLRETFLLPVKCNYPGFIGRWVLFDRFLSHVIIISFSIQGRLALSTE